MVNPPHKPFSIQVIRKNGALSIPGDEVLIEPRRHPASLAGPVIRKRIISS
jgi:hypothetical protein